MLEITNAHCIYQSRHPSAVEVVNILKLSYLDAPEFLANYSMHVTKEESQSGYDKMGPEHPLMPAVSG